MRMDREKNTAARPEGEWIIGRDDPVLVTGAAGFIGARVVDSLLRHGFRNIRCFIRPTSDRRRLEKALQSHDSDGCRIVSGNLLSPEDCAKAAEGVRLAIHLVAGRGKSFPACFQNSVVTTRNLLDALIRHGNLARFVNVSSIAVYSNFGMKRGSVFDEHCGLEDDHEKRFDAYVFGKLKQDELVLKYHEEQGISFTTIRPGVVFGPGKKAIPGLVGIDTFGVFLHMGGGNRVPLTYVDNCADAIVLAGLVPGVDGESFNVIDDDLPRSREFLRAYKKNVGSFWSIRVPYHMAYFMCWLWEKYSTWSSGQLPPVFNRRLCSFAWKGHEYPNEKLKSHLGWSCRVSMDQAMDRYFASQDDE